MPKYTYDLYVVNTVIVEAASDYEGRLKLVDWFDRYNEAEKRANPDSDIEYKEHSMSADTLSISGESISPLKSKRGLTHWIAEPVDSIGE